MKRASSQQLHIQFIIYALVGGLATAAQYVTLIGFVKVMHTSAILASTIGLVIGSIISYILNHRYTFQSEKRHHQALLQFYTIAAVAMLLNALFMYLGIHTLQLHYLTAQIVSTGLVLLWNFTCNRFWTFRL